MIKPSKDEIQYQLAESLRPVARHPAAFELYDVLLDTFQIVLTSDYLMVPHNENTWHHEFHVLHTGMLIGVGENIPWSGMRVLGLTAVVHDSHVVRRKTEEQIRDASPSERPLIEQQRKADTEVHLRLCAENVPKILAKVNRQRPADRISPCEIAEVERLVKNHDNPKLGCPIPTSDQLLVVFREADRGGWMQSREGLRCDIARKKKKVPSEVEANPRELAAQSLANMKSFEDERTRCYPGDDSGEWRQSDFIDSTTLFRTRTGWELVQSLHAQWLLIANYEGLNSK